MVLTPVAVVVVVVLVLVVVAADTLVVDNTDHMYLLFGHIADIVDNIDSVELVDELVVVEQVVEPVVAVAVDEMLVVELDLELLAVDACMHCSCIVGFVHVGYLRGSLLVEQQVRAKDSMEEEQVLELRQTNQSLNHGQTC